MPCSFDHKFGHWVCERAGGTYSESRCVAVGRETSDGRILGGFVYDGYNGKSIRMHVAGEGNWLSEELLHMAFWYPFEQLKVTKVIGLIESTNPRCIRLAKRLGFVQEAEIKDAAPDGDWLILTLTREQCKYLGDK